MHQQRFDAGLSPWKVMLVSSSRHPDQWIVPGGGMEPEEEPCGAAVREVYEEVSSSTVKKCCFCLFVFFHMLNYRLTYQNTL